MRAPFNEMIQNENELRSLENIKSVIVGQVFVIIKSPEKMNPIRT